MLNRKMIKADARQLLGTARVSPFVMTAIVMLIVFLLDRVSDLVEYGSLFYTYEYNAAYMAELMQGNLAALPKAVHLPGSPWSSFFVILTGLLTIILYGGYYNYCIGIRRGIHMPYSTLLDGLTVSGKLNWCGIQMAVKTFLWMLLFFVPGLIAMYRYRFAYYNILVNPSLSASEAIRLSCRQTSGMKGQLFVLDLSFLGWVLLPDILSNFFSWVGLYPLAILTPIAVQVWVMSYMTLCDLAYFEEGQRRMNQPEPWGGF